MVITTTTIISAIKRHLSIIGKRMYGKDGKNMFSDITLSSAEDQQILRQYISASIQDVESVLKQFITSISYSDAGETITITIQNTRGDADFDDRAYDQIVSYATLNSVGEYLSMVHPELSQKYYEDAQQRMESLVLYVVYKNPPAVASVDPISSVTTTIS